MVSLLLQMGNDGEEDNDNDGEDNSDGDSKDDNTSEAPDDHPSQSQFQVIVDEVALAAAPSKTLYFEWSIVTDIDGGDDDRQLLTWEVPLLRKAGQNLCITRVIQKTTNPMRLIANLINLHSQ
jgi:hypothetical protein